MSVRDVLLVEWRVATSAKAQPVWFRVVKWTLLVAVLWHYGNSPHFWRWLGAAFVVSIAVHMFWRMKTKRWTRAWGGWSDLDAPKGQETKRRS